jgi:hypothetical protein
LRRQLQLTAACVLALCEVYVISVCARAACTPLVSQCTLWVCERGGQSILKLAVIALAVIASAVSALAFSALAFSLLFPQSDRFEIVFIDSLFSELPLVDTLSFFPLRLRPQELLLPFLLQCRRAEFCCGL